VKLTAREIVVVAFGLTACLIVLLPTVSRMLHPEAPPLPESVSNQIASLTNMMIGSLATLLGLSQEKAS